MVAKSGSGCARAHAGEEPGRIRARPDRGAHAPRPEATSLRRGRAGRLQVVHLAGVGLRARQPAFHQLVHHQRTRFGRLEELGGVNRHAYEDDARIVIPRDNEPDLEELPEETREELEFFPVDSIAEVFEVAFGKGKAARPRAAASGERQAALPSV